jgi:hypothetical protein
VEILNLGGASDNNSSAPKARKKMGVLLGIGALAAVTGLGSTLAATITLNNNTDVEFGQGVVQTTSCDPDDGITVTPVSTFDGDGGDEGEGSFNLATIDLTGIDANCSDKTLTLKGYGDIGETVLFTGQVINPGANATVTPDTVVDASDVYKITLESSDS